MKPRDYIILSGEDFVLVNLNSGAEQRFPATKEGADAVVKATCGYFGISEAARGKMNEII